MKRHLPLEEKDDPIIVAHENRKSSQGRPQRADYSRCRIIILDKIYLEDIGQRYCWIPRQSTVANQLFEDISTSTLKQD